MKKFAISIDVDTPIIEANNFNCLSARVSFTKFIPRILKLLKKYHAKATFFIVGKFARDKIIADKIREIYQEGHEIANHSSTHNKFLSDMVTKDMLDEIKITDDILSNIIQNKIIGFRAPGYVLSDKLLDIVKSCGYLYDSSLNTSWVYYLVKLAWYIFNSKDRELLKLQPLKHCFLPDKPFYWRGIYEIPMSIVPFASFPFQGLLLNKNYKLTKFFYNLLKNNNKLQLELHEIEFAQFGEFKENNIYTINATKDITQRINFYDKLLNKISRDYEFTTLGEFLPDDIKK